MREREGPLIDGRRPHAVLQLRGALDVAGATEAHKRLLGLELRRGSQLVLDLSQLGFIDSTGIRLLLQAQDHAARHGAAFAIVPGPERVMRVLELVGLEDQLDTVAPA